MGSGIFEVQYIDTVGNVCFESVSAVCNYNAADLVRSRLPVDEIVSITELPYAWLQEY